MPGRSGVSPPWLDLNPSKGRILHFTPKNTFSLIKIIIIDKNGSYIYNVSNGFVAEPFGRERCPALLMVSYCPP